MAKNMSVHHSSASDEWETPPEIFDPLMQEFTFTLDAAASADNHKVVPYLDINTDALTQDWAELSTRWCKGNGVVECQCTCHKRNALFDYCGGRGEHYHLEMLDNVGKGESPKPYFQQPFKTCKWCAWCTPIVGSVWLNPPYSMLRQFVAKAAEERRKGATTVMLIPARTDTRAFHDHIWDLSSNSPRPGIEVRFLKGRIRFVGADNSAPFPSMVVVFKSDCVEVK